MLILSQNRYGDTYDDDDDDDDDDDGDDIDGGRKVL